MTITLTLQESANFAALAYGNIATPPQGWELLLDSNDQLFGQNGYHGRAYIKLVNGNPTELVIAHRGTEPTDIGDLRSDIQLSLGKAAQQLNDANRFVEVVNALFRSQYGFLPTSLTTHIGHSLGGYLAINMAHGSSTRAVTFDNPKTGLTQTNAEIVSVLNDPNYINTAGTGTHLGTVLRLDSDRLFELNEHGNSLANLFGKYANKIVNGENGMVAAFDLMLPVNSISPVNPLKLAIGAVFAKQTLDEHGISNIKGRLDKTIAVATKKYDITQDTALRLYVLGLHDTENEQDGLADKMWKKQLANSPVIAFNHLQFTGLIREAMDDIDFNEFKTAEYVLIGNDNNNQLSGGNNNHVVFAKKGNDRIQLGNGINEIYAGDGQDTIISGTGDDHHIPGKGDDLMQDSGGYDKYYFSYKDGHDTIDDKDGKGEIQFNAAPISGKAEFLDNVCSPNRWFINRLDAVFVLTEKNNDLVITIDDVNQSSGQSITIRDFDFVNGQMGISLSQEKCNNNKTALAWRDPNLVTFDKLKYDFMAPGDYTLVKGKGVNDTFEIRVRNKLLNERVSVIDAVAIDLDGTKLMLTSPQKKPAPTPTPLPTHTPTPIPTKTPIPTLSPASSDPFDFRGLTLLEGTSGNDNLQAQQSIPTLIYGKPDNGLVQFSPVSGNITVVYSSPFTTGNIFGSYTSDSNGYPVSGKIYWKNLNTAVGSSFTFNQNITSTQLGYFLIPQGDTFTHQQLGLADGINVTFGQVNGEWSVFINGTALNSNRPFCRAFFSDSTLNPRGYRHQYTYDGTQSWTVKPDCGNSNDDYYYSNVLSSAREGVSSITTGDVLQDNNSNFPTVYLYNLGTDGVDYISSFYYPADTNRILFTNGTKDDVKLYPVNIQSTSTHGTFIRTPDKNGRPQGIYVDDQEPWAVASRLFFNNTNIPTLNPTVLPTILPTILPTLPPTTCEDMVYINGECIGLNPGQVKAVNTGIIARKTGYDQNKYTVITNHGDGFTVHIYEGYINVYPSLSRSRANDSVHGLLGNNDGKYTNDIALPNGKVISQPVPESVLYGEYAKAWNVEHLSPSWFVDKSNEKKPTYNDPRFLKQYLTLKDFSPEQVEQARKQAIGFGFKPTSPIFNDTVFELLAGGVDVTGGPQSLGVDESDFYGVQELKVRTQRNNLNGGAVFAAVFFPVAIVVGGIVLTAYLCKHPEKLVAAKDKTLELGGKAKDKLIVAKDGLVWGCGKVKDGTLWGLGKAKDGIVKGGKKFLSGCKSLWNKCFGTGGQQQDVENQDREMESQFKNTGISLENNQQTLSQNKEYLTLEEKDVPQTPKGNDDVTVLDIEGNEVVGNSNTPPQLPKKPIEFKHTQKYLASKQLSYTPKGDNHLVVEDSYGNIIMEMGGNKPTNVIPFVQKEKPPLPTKPLRVGEVLESFLKSEVAGEHFKENPKAKQEIIEQLGKVLNYKENEGSYFLLQMKIDPCFDNLVEAITLVIESKNNFNEEIREEEDNSLKENVTEALLQAVEYLSKNRVIN